MSKRSDLEKILKSEYGIGSIGELEKAIEGLGSVDISLFCSNTKPRRRKQNEQRIRSQDESLAYSKNRSILDRDDNLVPDVAFNRGIDYR